MREETKNKSQAPALERGIQTLRLLSKRGEMTLESISVEMDAPKSSLKRILDTLIDLNMVLKDEKSKRYKVLYKLIPTEGDDSLLDHHIDMAIREVSSVLDETIEWYRWTDGAMTIVKRQEALNKNVTVRAQIGFRRDPLRELEAVNRVSFAYGLIDDKHLDSYHISKGGKWLSQSREEAELLVSSVKEDKAVMDPDYNKNGVRRYAIAVEKSNGDLLGILSIAESFRPGDDNLRDHYKDQLIKTASNLTSKIKTIRI